MALTHPSGVLLAVQLIGVLAYPFMEDAVLGRVGFEAFGALVLTLAVLSVAKSRTPTWLAISLAVVASGLSIIEAFNPSTTLDLLPGSFIAAVDSESARTWVELLFLSFTTLSSTGIGDVLPVTAHARSVVMIEQLAGLAYVALVVSRLVGLTLRRRPGSESDTELEREMES